MASDCPILKENEELKAEVEQLKKRLQEVVDETRSRLTDESSNTD